MALGLENLGPQKVHTCDKSCVFESLPSAVRGRTSLAARGRSARRCSYLASWRHSAAMAGFDLAGAKPFVAVRASDVVSAGEVEGQRFARTAEERKGASPFSLLKETRKSPETIPRRARRIAQAARLRAGKVETGHHVGNARHQGEQQLVSQRSRPKPVGRGHEEIVSPPTLPIIPPSTPTPPDRPRRPRAWA